MKVNFLETHDRLEHFKKQNFSISECCEDLIKQRPFGDRPFYIFAHGRTDDDGVTKRLIWQPRLTKPKAQTNSMLFRATPGTDIIIVIWILPPRELWEAYQRGMMMEDSTVIESIKAFLYDRASLERPEPDDPDDETVKQIYMEISKDAQRNKNARRQTEDSR